MWRDMWVWSMYYLYSHVVRTYVQEQRRFAAEREQEVRRQIAQQQEMMSRRMEEMRVREARLACTADL